MDQGFLAYDYSIITFHNFTKTPLPNKFYEFHHVNQENVVSTHSCQLTKYKIANDLILVVEREIAIGGKKRREKFGLEAISAYIHVKRFNWAATVAPMTFTSDKRETDGRDTSQRRGAV